MTGTEMIDAIAHIDEDLIDGCLARMKARVSERQALAAAEASAEHLEKPSSPFKMAALAFGAVAAAVVIMLGLISILHIGGKSPQPVGPVVTDSTAPTESATEAPTEEPTPILTPVDTFAEEILSVPVKWYSYDELSASPELGEEMTYLESIEDMEMVHYSPEAFCVTDDGEIAIVDTVGARLCVYDLASGQLKRSAKVGEILETPPIRVSKYGGVYYVLIPYSDSRIVAVYPDGTTSEIPVPQLKGMLEYSHVSEFYAEDGRLILTLIGPSSIETKAVSLSDGSVTGLYSTQWTLENDTFTVTRNGMRWSFPAEPSSGVRSSRIDVLKVGENGELYVIQEVPIEGQDDMGLYQIYDKDGRLLRCEKIDYFMDSYMTADGGRTVGPDDNLYEMYCDEDAVRIIRIVPAEQTAGTEPTEIPAVTTDTDVLRAFFELADGNGVKNGEKLFPNYDPADTATWIDEDPFRKNSVTFDDQGRVTGLTFRGTASAPIELVGKLDLNRFDALEGAFTWMVTFEEIAADDLPVADKQNSAKFQFPMVYGEARFTGGYVDGLYLRSKSHVFCDITGEAESYLSVLPSYRIDVNVEGEGFAGVSAYDDENFYEVHLVAEPIEGYEFIGWFDADGVLVSSAENYTLYGEDNRISCEGAHGEHYFTARFTGGGETALTETPTAKPTATPTAAPTATPTAKPTNTPKPTETPKPSETAGFFMELKNGVTAYADLDGDGTEDSVMAEEIYDPEDEYGFTRIHIGLANKPEFIYDTGSGWGLKGAIVDCDPSDSRKEIIVCNDWESSDYSTYALRYNGETWDVFTGSFLFGTEGSFHQGFPSDFSYDPSKGLPMCIRTEIFGTYYVSGRFTVKSSGIKIVSKNFYYPERYVQPLTLKRDMDVTLENGSSYTVPTGSVIIPRYTDRETSAAVELADGRMGTVRISFDNHHRVLINGIDQDEYAVMPYAD